MHNLAVLDADGGGKGANYKSASQWFRKAAERGVADSQFNLGILYARGIGVEQNLAESFKWFSLAAAQGDADPAASATISQSASTPSRWPRPSWRSRPSRPKPQPDDAVNVASPAGGWDSAPGAGQVGKGPAAASRLRPSGPRVNLNYSPRFGTARQAAAKKPASADSLIPPADDFGYAEARLDRPRRRSEEIHAASGFGRPRGQIRSERACSFIFRSPTFRSMCSSSWRWARRSASCPACSASAAAS